MRLSFAVLSGEEYTPDRRRSAASREAARSRIDGAQDGDAIVETLTKA
jgi:hypothetical protein